MYTMYTIFVYLFILTIKYLAMYLDSEKKDETIYIYNIRLEKFIWFYINKIIKYLKYY